MQFTQKDLSFAKNTIAFIAKAKIELAGTEIMAASDMLRWLYMLTQSIEKELQEQGKPLSPSPIEMSSPISDPKPVKAPRIKKPKE
jgi:hypothetical protein